jgi:hypothetical protein
MGQAKKKNEKRKKDHLLSKPLSLARFNLYTLGTRFSMARVMAEELSWWADRDEKLIGFVFRDTTDNDWILLARDRAGRFRAVNVEASLRSRDYATVGLRDAIANALANENITELGFQGDEPNEPFDGRTRRCWSVGKILRPGCATSKRTAT